MLKKIIKVGIFTILLMFSSVPVIAADDIIYNLGNNAAYWQELAVKQAIEMDNLKLEVERLTKENNNLTENLKLAEETINSLHQSVNDMAIQVERVNSLREQAETALKQAAETIKTLENLVNQFSGPRFGIVAGATYDLKNQLGLLAGITFTL